VDVRTLAGPTNAIRHDGKIVATQLFLGNVVDAQDPSDVLIGGGLLGIPLGLASDGETLYVGDWATGIVWAVGPGGPVPLATGLNQPAGLAVDGDRLLVVETGEQRVIGIDLATGAQSEVIVGFDFTLQNPIGFFPFGQISSVAVGGDGSLYVSDDGTNSVYRFRRSQAGGVASP
jgi:sugar lactone lactonase YvrE